jgi:hypothetical protein
MKCALGLQAPPLFSAAKVINLSTCAQTETLDESLKEISFERSIAVPNVDIVRPGTTSNDNLRKNIDTGNGTTLATSGQCFDFDDSMDTSAWEWNRFLDFSPLDGQCPPDNES